MGGRGVLGQPATLLLALSPRGAPGGGLCTSASLSPARARSFNAPSAPTWRRAFELPPTLQASVQNLLAAEQQHGGPTRQYGAPAVHAGGAEAAELAAEVAAMAAMVAAAAASSRAPTPSGERRDEDMQDAGAEGAGEEMYGGRLNLPAAGYQQDAELMEQLRCVGGCWVVGVLCRWRGAKGGVAGVVGAHAALRRGVAAVRVEGAATDGVGCRLPCMPAELSAYPALPHPPPPGYVVMQTRRVPATDGDAA